jgi:hypothetical protein
MGRFIGMAAVASAMVFALNVPQTSEARGLTPENRAELANVPPGWKDAHICFQEGGGAGGPRVVIGVEGKGANAQYFSLRPEKVEATLPSFLLNRTGDSPGRQLWVTPAVGVGYTDEYFEVFVMPNGVRMTCEALPER